MNTEDYLNYDRYQNRPASVVKDFSAFQDEQTNLYYFAMLDNSGNVLLISEGYPSETARDSGINSVVNNRELDERYKLRTTADGKYYLSLTAANFQEIAITDFFDTEAEAMALLPSERRKTLAALESITTEANGEDNYLSCNAYRGHPQSANEGFTVFTHSNGQHYFAMVDNEGNIILRSEGYSSSSARDNGIQSVIKNKDIPERYQTRHFTNGTRIISLLASNRKEIARSCPIDDEQGLFGLFPLLAPPPMALSGSKEDDYLPCHEYTGFEPDENGIARFEKNGQQYFVWYNNEGKVLLRSEGFDTESELQEELAMVLKFRNDESKYEYIDKAGHRIKVLKDNTGREVGRSCAEKYVTPVMAAPIAAEMAAPVAAPIVVPAAAEPEGRFRWWWIILPLLLALFIWWRGCEKKAEEANVPVIKPIDSAKVSSSETMEAPKIDTVVKEAAPVTTTEKIKSVFFDFAKADLSAESTANLDRVVTVLEANPDYKVKLSAYADSKGSDAYNAALSRKRAAATKAYLVSKGINASRIQTSIFGEKDPIARNTLNDGTDTEAGRHFNRRVEISILKDGVVTDLVEKIEVPEDLKK